jgi:DNA-binding NtrC family response regulator
MPGTNMKKILLVDDEQNVLNALRRELKDHFETETFDNPLSALERCREAQFDLVIADYKMPEMNGIEFLKQFGILQPDAARLVLSGEADIDALVRTINETHIYRFLAKPWEKAELLSSIRHALAYRETILENRRQANLYRESHTPSQTHEEDASYRIVLVEGDERLLTMMSQGLSDDSGRENLYGAMQKEIKQGAPTKKFKCVVNSFRSAQPALAHAEKAPCDLVITAQNLSDMDGIQLLRKMRLAQPDVARILICDEPDKAVLSQAINEAEVKNLLSLHWSSYDLRADVRRQAWNLYQLKTAAIQALASRDLLLENIRLAGLT